MYTEERPWGRFTILEESENYKVKRIEVLSGQRLSYQYHHKREENWCVVQGLATVTLNEQDITLKRGESVFISKESRHRVSNHSSDLLVFIEVQTGDYFGEDDIVRLEDDYNRE